MDIPLLAYTCKIRFTVTAQQITETGGKPITNYIVHTKRSQCNELE